MRTPFPDTLAGLLDALDAAQCRSPAAAPKVVVIIDGKQRTADDHPQVRGRQQSALGTATRPR